MISTFLLNIVAVDTMVNNYLLSFYFKHPTLLTIFTKITFFGSFQFIFLISILFVAFFLLLYFLTDDKSFVNKYVYPYLFAIFFTCVSVYYSKLYFMRDGPIGRSLLESDYSFPSGHATFAFVFFGFLFVFFKNKFKGSGRNIFLSFTILMILSVGVSRLILNVHFLSDVLAGYVLGFFVILLTSWMSKK